MPSIGSIYINKMIDLMLDYQKKNDVKGMCINNSMLLCSLMKSIGFEGEIMPCFVIAETEVGETQMILHMVVKISKSNEPVELLDPSYEVAQHEFVSYFTDFGRYKKAYDGIEEQLRSRGVKCLEFGMSLKSQLTKYIEFKDFADEYNSDTSTQRIPADEYYLELREYMNEHILKIQKECVEICGI
jgi:hypothetical protein